MSTSGAIQRVRNAQVHFAVESRAAAWVIRNDQERFCLSCIQYRKRSRSSQLHCWAMVGWGYKLPNIVFFDSNDNTEPSDWIYEAIAVDNQPPQPVIETEEEEFHLRLRFFRG